MICKNMLGLLTAFAVVALAGCGRPMPNDPAANSESAEKIRATLVSASKTTTGTAAETEAAPQATGIGTIKGRFVYEGQAAAPAAINVSKDIEVCGQHHLIDESLLVDSQGGLANAVVYARNKNLKSDKPAEGEVVLDNNGCHFQPHIAVMQTGQTLIVKNSDPVAHNTNASLTNAPFNDTVAVGTHLTKKITLPEPAPAPVVCTIHPWMKGYIVVQPHPYVAVSAKDGTFEIKNVPAGIPLEFQAWHEASTNHTGALVAERPDLKWQPNGRFTVTVKPDESLDLGDLKVPAASLAAK